MIERANQFNAVRADGARPNPSRWTLFKREAESGTLDDYRYTVGARPRAADGARGRRGHARGAEARRDRVSDLAAPAGPDRRDRRGTSAGGGSGLAPTNIANLTGFPDLIVPAGFTGDNLPVGAVVPRPGVQRGEAAGARLQLRAGDERAPAAGAHAGPPGRVDLGAVVFANDRSYLTNVPVGDGL